MTNQPIEEKWKDTFVEEGASIEHDRWARWQKYMFSKGVVGPDGEFHLPAEFVDRWFRQIDTPYSELSESEKESDRKETRNYLPIIKNLLEQEKKRLVSEIEKKATFHEVAVSNVEVKTTRMVRLDDVKAIIKTR